MKICEVCGITSNQTKVTCSIKFNQTLCNKHYKHLNRHGRILSRTRFDENEYVINEGYVEIVLYDNNNQEKARTLIDMEDFEKAKTHKWYLDNSGHVLNRNKKVNTFLHRFLLDLEDDSYVVDHINRNPLDNQKHNLRICKHQENLMNQSKRVTNTSGVTGVYWHKKASKWSASIKYKYKNIYLGLFDDLEDAKQVRLEAENKYFKEFAPQIT